MVDWLEDLAGFPEEAIAHACRHWRQSQPRKRPTPGAIRNLAAAWVKHEEDMGRIERPRLPAPEQPQRVKLDDAARARAAEHLDQALTHLKAKRAERNASGTMPEAPTDYSGSMPLASTMDSPLAKLARASQGAAE